MWYLSDLNEVYLLYAQNDRLHAAKTKPTWDWNPSMLQICWKQNFRVNFKYHKFHEHYHIMTLPFEILDTKIPNPCGPPPPTTHCPAPARFWAEVQKNDSLCTSHAEAARRTWKKSNEIGMFQRKDSPMMRHARALTKNKLVTTRTFMEAENEMMTPLMYDDCFNKTLQGKKRSKSHKSEFPNNLPTTPTTWGCSDAMPGLCWLGTFS